MQPGGRVFCLEGDKEENPIAVVSCTLLVNHLYAHALFDSSATLSFVNPIFVKKLASKPDEMDVQLYVTILLGSTHHTDVVFKDCAINLEGRILPANLVQLGI